MAAFALAFVQQPGRTAVDSRIELSANVALFLDRIKDVWSSTLDLGHVQSGQFVGYLFPMGPWYWAWDLTGLPTWIGQRLWLGALLAFAAWGVVRLMDVLYDEERGLGHLFAGAVYITAPYVATFANGASITLLAYAALPWLLVFVHRGLDSPRGWRWPALGALLIAVMGGGTNATVLAWIVFGALALVAYEVLALGRTPRATASFLWRTALCTALASAWWIGPVLVQGSEADQFLEFTERPETIWATTSLSESVRGLGYWVLYLAVRNQPVRAIADDYFFDPVVIVATFMVPLVAIAGLRRTRSWSHGPFFALLAVAALLVMSAGFPEGAPMRRLLIAAYDQFESLQFLRTTHKATPLLALSVACLGGVALAALADRASAGRLTWRSGRRVPAWVPWLALALPLLAGLPLVTGQAIERSSAYGDIPAYWREAAADLDRSTPPGKRSLVLPGTLFSFYRWGNTVNSVAPAIARRPLLIREVVRYAPRRASQLQAEVDDLVQQRRLVPGQLDPLLKLMGVGQVLVQSDYLTAASGAIDRASLAGALQDQSGFTQAAEDYGESRTYVPAPGRGGPRRRRPDLRRYETPGSSGPGLVRLHRRARATVLDGDAEGIAGLAAIGRLDPGRALFYAGDLDRRRLERMADRGATLVFSDSHRRRVLESNQLQANRGPTLGASDTLPDQFPSYDLFPERGTAAQTVARYSGLEYLRAPRFRSFSLFPEHRPYAALDGRLDTSWIASEASYQPEKHRWIELALRKPRFVPSIRIFPHGDRLGDTDEVGLSLDGGPERRIELGPGWSRVPVSRKVRRIRLRAIGTDGFTSGGIAELRVPGLDVRESLRLPTELSRLAKGLSLAGNPMIVLLHRTTADSPYRAGSDVGDAQSGNQLDMVDAEPGLVRDVTLPVGRSFGIGGWASIDPKAPDERIDELVGLPPGWSFNSASRFEGVPGHRASSAFDGDRSTAWVGDALPGQRPWISWQGPIERPIRTITLSPGPPEYGFPRRVRIDGPDGFSVKLRVSRDGEIVLPRAVRTRGLRIYVLASKPPRKEARALRATAVSEVTVPGVQMPRGRRDGRLEGRCGDIVARADGRSATGRLTGSVGDLDAGRPLRIRGCSSLVLPSGTTRVVAPPGRVARPDYLAFTSAALAPGPRVPAASGHVRFVDGRADAGDIRDVRLDVDGPSWLVLAESHSSGWRAWCYDAEGRERELGSPEPIDGYANGWPVDGSCKRAHFAFAREGLARVSYAVSAAAALALLLLALLAPGENRPATRRGLGGMLRVSDPIERLQLRGALLAGAVAGVAGTLFFAVRAGVVLAPLAFVLARVGVTVSRLVVIAAAALSVALLLYLVHPAPSLAGFTFSFPTHHLNAHWAVAVCVSCLAVAGVLAAGRVRAAGGGQD